MSSNQPKTTANREIPQEMDDTLGTVQLLVADEGNRITIRKMLSEYFDVETAQTVQDADLYLIEDHLFSEHHEALRKQVERAHPTFCPVVLIRRETTALANPAKDGAFHEGPVLIDDVVDAPIDRSLLIRRLHSLLVRRRQSQELSDHISTLEKREQELRRFERAVEENGTATVITDTDGVIEYANSEFKEMTGYIETDVLRQPLETFLAEESLGTLDESFWQTMAEEREWKGELLIERKHDQRRVTDTTITVIRNDAGVNEGFVVVMPDITQRIEREQLLQDRQEELDLLRQILSRYLRHNLRNDLNVILGYAELLEEKLSDQDAHDATKIIDPTKRLIDTSEKARKYSTLIEQESDLAPHDVSAIIEGIVSDIREQYPDVSIEVELPDECYVLARDGIQDAIQGLVDNAARHNDAESPWVHITVTDLNGAQVVIKDNGPGISELELATLEQGSETPLKHSQGIGLWLSKWVLERVDGRLSFDTTDLGGTRVTIDFPQAEQVGAQGVSVSDLKAREQRLRTITQRMTDAVIEVDGSWKIIFADEQAERILTVDADAIQGQHFWDVFSDARETRFEEVDRDVMRSRSAASIEEYYEGIDGWLEVYVYPDFDGGLSFYFRDITARKKREQELKRKERRYQAIFNDPNILVALIDTDGTVRNINQTALEYIDAAVDDVISEPFWESPWFNHSKTVVEEVKDWIDRAAAGEYIEFEVELVRPDGEPYTVEGAFRPVTNEDGEVVSLLISGRDITKQKQRETELETVRRRFEAVLENTTTPMFMKGDDGAYIFVNQAYCDLFNLQDVEIVGRTDHDIHPPEMAADVQKNDQAVIDGGQPIETEEQIVINDEERIFLSTKVPIYDTGKRSNPDTPVATFGVAVDITDRKEAEQQLREERQFVQSIFQSLPDPLYAFNTDGYLLRWNEKFEDVTGYSSAEIEDMHVTDFVPDTEVETISAKFQAILDEDQAVTVESAFETKDGICIPYEFTGGPVEAADGTTRGVTGIGRDIVERTARERQLEALNRIAQELMSADTRDEVVEIGIETTRDLLGIEVNSIHLYDADADALVPVLATDAVYDLIGDPPTFSGEDSIAWRVYQQGDTLAVDNVHENPDRYNPDTPIRSELFLPLGKCGILLAASPSPKTFDDQDILMGNILSGGLTTALEQVEGTEQLRAREQELTRQNDQLEEFASIVSHDLRNPLNVATGHLELAAAECDSEHLEHVEQAHERMQTLIEDILALAREGVAVADSEPIALGPLVEGCWETVETGETRLVTNSKQTVQADRSRLKQVFENLIRNAVEHGGEDVTVTVGELADGFYIEDDGSGIPADERETIFNAGYSTSEDGTGFGLSIIKQIVDAHNWKIHVMDSDDGGARFEITGVEVAAE